jgi:hypothetical protein
MVGFCSDNLSHSHLIAWQRQPFVQNYLHTFGTEQSKRYRSGSRKTRNMRKLQYIEAELLRRSADLSSVVHACREKERVSVQLCACLVELALH